MTFFWIYLAAASLLGLAVMAVDKRRAKKAGRRISEKAIFILAWLGASPGVLAGMHLFRHKTKHAKFTVGVPFILAAQCTVVLLVLWGPRIVVR